VSAVLSRGQTDALNAYMDELERWNQRLNLTSVTREDAWSRHVEQSLHLLEIADPPEGAAVVDIGSGSGAPGLVVAVARPDLAVTLVEADGRKAAFLVHVAGMLGLDGVGVAPVRAEEAGHDPGLRERFDRALSRAAAKPRVLVELALPLLRPGGLLCALVTDAPAAARSCRAAAAVLGGGEPAGEAGTLTVPKVARTPAEFPRRPGVPTRHPLP